MLFCIMHDWYAQWKSNVITIVTRHGKEAVIGPPLQKLLDITYKVSESVNTDELGTFSGEIERKHDALTTARKKCEAAFNLEKATLCVASEGSFYPDPNLPYITVNDEWLVFKDFTNDFELAVRSTTHQTNFAATVIHDERELQAFIHRIHFPSHAVILRPAEKDFSELYKGIRSYEELEKLSKQLLQKHNQLYIETDMRAHLNPTRMQHIARLAQQLAERLSTSCKACGYPGFGVTAVEKGLPCKHCGMPSNYVKNHVCVCSACNYTEVIPYPNGKNFIDPMYCQFCNP